MHILLYPKYYHFIIKIKTYVTILKLKNIYNINDHTQLIKITNNKF